MMKAALILALASLVHGYYDDCKFGLDVNWLGYYRNEEAIRDDTNGEFMTIEKGEITEVVVEEGGYITAQIIDDKIVFSTTDRFQNIEYEMENDDRDNEFETEFVFKCPNGRVEVRFYQPLEDINQHAPFFNRKNYVYRFGMPIAKDFDLTKLLDVLATDVDLTDNHLKYKMVTGDDSLKIESKGSYTYGNLGKTRAAKIVTLKEIPSGFSHNFEILVDDGRNKTGKARVTLQID